VEKICGEIIHRDSAARMSANPHNTSLGLTDGETIGKAADSLLPSPPPPAIPAVTYPPGHEALQALLAFSSLHEQLRQRRNREQRRKASDPAEVWELEPFVLDEVLHLVAERALNITGADGVAIAMAEGNAIVCRASAGTIAPDPGARLDPNSGFSGACLRSGGIVRCDDSEKDRRVDVPACRRLGTRSMVAVPIAGLHGTIGLLEAFSAGPYGFNDSDVRSLNLLAELILAALKPEEEGRLAELSQRLVAGESAEASSGTVSRGEERAQPPASAENNAPVSAEPEIDRASLESKPIGKFRVGLMVLLVVLAAISGTVTWWKIIHRAPPPTGSASPPASESSPATDQPTTSSQAAENDSPHILDPKLALRQLVTGIWHVSSADSSTVVIDVQGEVQYEAHRLSDPERIYIDLHDTALAPGLFGKTIEVGDALLARVRIAQPRRGVSRVVLETTGASDFSVSLQSNPYRLVVEIRKAAQSPSGPVSDSKSGVLVAIAPPPPSLTLPAPARNRRDVPSRIHVPKFRLVLDAGHGGWDLGTVGRKGLMEKDLVLDIVERLGKLLQSRLDAEIIYTREQDNYLPLEKRTEIANLAQADMFVSVHANYSNDSSARGAETYYTNTYSSLKARAPETDAKEADGKQTDAKEVGANLAVPENVNWTDVDIREKVRQSRRFALAVQQSLYRALAAQIPGMRNRGVKKASYVVLTGTSMPAILAEVSFVSNTGDEDKLQSSSYRQAIAEALYTGVARFAATSHRVNMASTPAKHIGL
jgi:N-acetylmuramoyl-L-alanine amidase